MINSKSKDAFWDVVEDCLVEIHGLSKLRAHQRSQDLRTGIETPPAGMSSEIFYHAEPFDVACDIADIQLDLSQHRSQYDHILNRHNW